MDGSPGHLEALGWKLMLSLRASVSAPRISPIRELGLIHSCYMSLGGSLHLSEFSADSLSVDILRLKERSLSSPGLTNISQKVPESFGSSGCQEQEQLHRTHRARLCPLLFMDNNHQVPLSTHCLHLAPGLDLGGPRAGDTLMGLRWSPGRLQHSPPRTEPSPYDLTFQH